MPLQALVFDYSHVLHFPLQGLNRDLLLFMQSSLRLRYRLYLFTASTGWREPEILRVIQPIFSGIFTVDELGGKADPETFRHLAQQVGSPVEELLLIDDAPENIQAMEAAGGQGIRYEGNQPLIDELRRREII
jgi:HAD superfamily hydrolase (TIGR01509 family)